MRKHARWRCEPSTSEHWQCALSTTMRAAPGRWSKSRTIAQCFLHLSKNSLAAADAKRVEDAFELRLSEFPSSGVARPDGAEPSTSLPLKRKPSGDRPQVLDRMLTLLESRRNKALGCVAEYRASLAHQLASSLLVSRLALPGGFWLSERRAPGHCIMGHSMGGHGAPHHRPAQSKQVRPDRYHTTGTGR